MEVRKQLVRDWNRSKSFQVNVDLDSIQAITENLANDVLVANKQEDDRRHAKLV